VPFTEQNGDYQRISEKGGECWRRPFQKRSNRQILYLSLHRQSNNKQQQTLFMETKILKVVRQGDSFSVQSSKSEAGQIQKCNIVLKELGGKFENEYVCAMLGSLAACRFYEGDVVAATLRFSTHEYQGQTFQEILATDIVKVNK
jgi:hypothetical protein